MLGRQLIRILVYPGAAFLVAASLLLHWADRKLVALWQGRVGPPWYQPLADLIKLLAKEDIVVLGTDERLSALLPVVALACTMTASLFIPVGNRSVLTFEGDLIVALFLLSIPSFAYFVAGWISSSTYGVLGGNRSLLMYFTYEVPLLAGATAPSLYAQTWRISSIMDAQRGYHWHALILPIGFAVAVVGLIGKLERVPFDMPHAKSEVGAGPMTEYSGRKLALWRLTLWMQTLVGINLLVALYLGGADRMWMHWGFGVYVIKVAGFVTVFALVQVLYARLRIDQMADIGWRGLVPLGLLQLLAAVWLGR